MQLLLSVFYLQVGFARLGWGVIKAFLSIKKWPMFTVSLFMYKTRSAQWFCSKPIFGPYPGPFPISKSAVNHRKLKFRFPYISSEIFSHTSFLCCFWTRNPNITQVFAQKFLCKFFQLFTTFHYFARTGSLKIQQKNSLGKNRWIFGFLVPKN